MMDTLCFATNILMHIQLFIIFHLLFLRELESVGNIIVPVRAPTALVIVLASC